MNLMPDKKWDKKLYKIREAYPEVRSIDWAELIRGEPEIFRSITGDVAKSTIPKKKVDHSSAAQSFAQLTNTDYSELCFVDALNVLWGGRSISDMVHKTKISKEIIYHMKRGTRTPTFSEMEQIARSFGKDPSYFLEYRIGKILASIDLYLQRSPETAALWHEKVQKAEGLKI